MRFWAPLLLAGCGSAAPKTEAHLVQIGPAGTSEETSPPTGMPAPFDVDRPVMVYRIVKATPLSEPRALLPGPREFGQETLAALETSGVLPPALNAAPFPPPPLEPSWLETGYTAVQKRVIEDPALRARLRRIFGRAGNFVAADVACFEPSMLFTFGDDRVAVSLPCNRATAQGFAWPHADDGIGEEARHWLESFHGSLFGAPTRKALETK